MTQTEFEKDMINELSKLNNNDLIACVRGAISKINKGLDKQAAIITIFHSCNEFEKRLSSKQNRVNTEDEE